jgi:hypothetical protein
MRKIITITICALIILPLFFCKKLARDVVSIEPVKVVPVVVEPVVEQIEPVKVPIELKTVARKDITKLAQDKLNDLALTGHWDHTNSNGCDFTCRAKPYLNDYLWIGENLYKGVCKKENAFRLWEKSPSHLEILNHEYNQEVLLMREYEENHCYIILIRGIRK